MSMSQGLPVHGYQPQSDARVASVNENKISEEVLLRRLDKLTALGVADPRWAAIAKTHLELAFMAFNRAVFQPSRVSLPEDGPK